MRKRTCVPALVLAIVLPVSARAGSDAETLEQLKNQMEQLQKQMQVLEKKIEAYEVKTVGAPPAKTPAACCGSGGCSASRRRRRTGHYSARARSGGWRARASGAGSVAAVVPFATDHADERRARTT